jgi:hypothetical protein
MNEPEERGALVTYREATSYLYIRVATLEGLRAFIKLFTELAEGELKEVDLRNLPFISLAAIASVVLRVSTENEGVRIVTREGSVHCGWTCSPTNWDLAVDMLHSLARGGKVGHQYLPPDRGKEDDSVVELEYFGLADPSSGWGRFLGDDA